MSSKSRLVTEKQRLEVERTKLARLSQSGRGEVSEDPSPDLTSQDSEEKNKPSVRFDYIFKIVIIGDATCGKTSLLKRYVDEVFHEQSLTTIGVDFKLKNIDVDGNSIKLQIWDTAGQERFAPLGGLYYHGAHAVIVAYDVTQKNTFDNIPKWCRKFEDRDSEGIDTVKVLVGCKSDMVDRREVSPSQGQTAAIETGARWGETSSRTGDNVERMFEEIAKAVLDRKRLLERKLSDMSIRPEHMDTGVEIILPSAEESQAHNSSGPLKVLKRLPKSLRRKGESEGGGGRNKLSPDCCKIS